MKYTTRTRHNVSLWCVFFLFASLIALTLFAAPNAHANTITVNDTSGGTGGPGCKLRDAISAANTDTATGGCPAGSGADIINLPSGATITLTAVDNGAGTADANGLPVIATTITLNGNNSVIERSIAAPNFRIFKVSSGGILTLNNVTIRNGRAVDGVSPGNAGASGGGIENLGGELTIKNSSISGNRTGDGNSSGGGGGGGGGIYSAGSLTITSSAITGNTSGSGAGGGYIGGYGGGIYSASGIFNISNSTISGNTTHTGPSGGGHGGGIDNGGIANVTNSTIARNTSAGNGGGVGSGGTLNLNNTIVANNTSGYGGANCNVVNVNGSNNIDSGTSCGWGSSNGSMSNTDPKLAPLGNYGGPTQTMALFIGSPAINKANANCPSTDQRGVARPGAPTLCDSGAFEGAWHPLYLPLIVR